MSRMRQDGYVEIKSHVGKPGKSDPTFRSYFIVKYREKGRAYIGLGCGTPIYLPKDMLGKTVRVKVEIVKTGGRKT